MYDCTKLKIAGVQNVGWRLDYVLVSERLADKLVDCIHRF